MDPEACLYRAYAAADEMDLDEANDALADYREWRSKGGFEPTHGDLRASALESWITMQSETGNMRDLDDDNYEPTNDDN